MIPTIAGSSRTYNPPPSPGRSRDRVGSGHDTPVTTPGSPWTAAFRATRPRQRPARPARPFQRGSHAHGQEIHTLASCPGRHGGAAAAKRVAPGRKAAPRRPKCRRRSSSFAAPCSSAAPRRWPRSRSASDTIVARVDEILHGADVVRDFAGEAITVQLSEDQSVTDGEDYIFHTNGWLFGASIAVVAVAVEPASDDGDAAAARGGQLGPGRAHQGPRRARRPGRLGPGDAGHAGGAAAGHADQRARARVAGSGRARPPRGARALAAGARAASPSDSPPAATSAGPRRRSSASARKASGCSATRSKEGGRAARRRRRAEGPVSRRRARGFLSEGSRRPRAVADRVGREEIMVKVVNVIPQSLSGETRQDSEPNIAVNPANHRPDRDHRLHARPDGRQQRPDLRLDRQRHHLGAEHHRAEPEHDHRHRRHHHALRRQRPLLRRHPAAPGQPAAERAAEHQLRRADGDVGAGRPDQRRSALHAGGNGPERDRRRQGPRLRRAERLRRDGGTTATVETGLDAAAASPTFTSVRVEKRGTGTAGQNGPQIRPAVHTDGTVYAIFYGWRAFSAASLVTSDVVVVRDDNWGKGATPFTALKDPSDNLGGRLVATGVQFTWNGTLGHDRLGGDLSIAVRPGQQLDRLHRVLRPPGRQLHDSRPPLDRSRPDLVGRPQDRVERQEPGARDRRQRQGRPRLPARHRQRQHAALGHPPRADHRRRSRRRRISCSPPCRPTRRRRPSCPTSATTCT